MTGNLSKMITAEAALMRLFLYGEAKTRKTTWAGAFAELGFNVLFLEMDRGGTQILRSQLSEKAKERVFVMNIADGFLEPIAALACAQLLRGRKVIWDITNQRQCIGGMYNEKSEYLLVDSTLLGHNDIIVVDSYTALVASVGKQVAKENNIDVFDASKPEWDFYRYEGAFLSSFLSQLNALGCHVICIGHEDTLEKRAKDPNDPKGKREIIVSSKTLIASSSRPHSNAQIGWRTGDIIYFFRDVIGNVKISTKGEKGRVGGGRNLKPADYNWENLQAQNIINELKLAPSGDAANPEALRYFRPGEILTRQEKQEKLMTPVVNASEKLEAPKGLIAAATKTG